MKIIVEVHGTSLEVRRALERFGRVVSERPENKSYTVEIVGERDPERRRVSVERMCERIGELGFVSGILLPGYRTLWSERWD